MPSDAYSQKNSAYNTDKMNRIAVLITCHNRREKTLACLRALYANPLAEGSSLHVILLDDGSTDGTEATVLTHYPNVEILRGDGSLFWNRGMHRAFARATEIGFDGYLWLNDDTLLYPRALEILIETWQACKASTGVGGIYVGSTQDPQSSEHTYGGVLSHNRWKPLRFTPVEPSDRPLECHTFNGNCVLIAHNVACQLGNLEPRFEHAMGDTDYGLRAGKLGIKIWVAPGYVGACGRNSTTNTFNDPALPLCVRWKKMLLPKGLPLASWWLFTRRHSGVFWPVYFIWPYCKLVISHIYNKLSEKRAAC